VVGGKQPAYGGESEAARLRRHLEDVQESIIRQAETEILMDAGFPEAAAQACEHHATYVARVCASCDTVMEIED